MKEPSSLHSCVIIGAGISGLLAARVLDEAGVDAIVLEKSAGLGGRMATRRIGNARFDHGAQYFTVRDDRFERLVQEWERSGVARLWSTGFPVDGEPGSSDGYPRYIGDDGMTSISKLLAIPLDVRRRTRVSAIAPDEKFWCVHTESGEEFEAEAVIVTTPVPQALELLAAGKTELPHHLSGQLRYINYDPCLTVLLVFDSPTTLPEPGGMKLAEGDVHWIADNHAKGISPRGYGVTIHTRPDFSRTHWDAPVKEIIQKVLPSVSRWLPGEPADAQVQRWRFSQPIVAHPKQFLVVDDPAPLIFAGDGFSGSRIEGAALSGTAAAKALLTRLS